MTSVGHVYEPPAPKTKFVDITTLSYSNADQGQFLPVPFTVTNGVLDIALTNSNVTAFVNNGTEYNNVGMVVAPMGGRTKVNAIGSNLRTWIENFTGTSGPYPIIVAPTMTKVQPRGFDGYDGGSDDSQGSVGPGNAAYSTTFTTLEPTGDEYIMASAASGTTDDFYTTWVFETPLTVQTPPWSAFSASNTTLTLNSLFNFR